MSAKTHAPKRRSCGPLLHTLNAVSTATLIIIYIIWCPGYILYDVMELQSTTVHIHASDIQKSNSKSSEVLITRHSSKSLYPTSGDNFETDCSWGFAHTSSHNPKTWNWFALLYRQVSAPVDLTQWARKIEPWMSWAGMFLDGQAWSDWMATRIGFD